MQQTSNLQISGSNPDWGTKNSLLLGRYIVYLLKNRIMYNKNDLEKMILIDNISYRTIGKIYNVSDTSIKKAAIKLGILLPKRKKFPKEYSPHNKGKYKTSICENCGSEIKLSTWKYQKFCNNNCYNEHKSENLYQYYINNQEEFCCDKNMKFVKKHILKEQHNKCSICQNNNIWNGEILIFILDHIDGNAYNNRRTNLRLICPNCDSQLDTYKSKNKNSARKDRYLHNYKN